MPADIASRESNRTKGKSGLELSDNARRDFIVGLAEQLRNLDSAADILPLAARLLGGFLLAERAGAYCVEDGAAMFMACWTAGRLPAIAGTLPIAIVGPKIIERYRARQTAVTTDVAAEGMEGMPATYSAIGVPLFRKGRWEGTFFIHREAGEPWRADEISLTEEVAQLSWDAHERALAAEKLHRLNETLRQRDAELSAALRSAKLVPFDYDMVRQTMQPSPGLSELYGYPPDHVLTLDDIRARYHPDMAASLFKEIAAQLQDPHLREYELNLHLLLPGGKVRWLNGRGEYFRDAQGKAYRSLGVVADVTERKELEETQRFLVQEMDHRIKNLLAMVIAVATQTIRNSDTLHAARIALTDRIRALAGAHDILVKGKWRSAAIKQVIAQSTASYPEMMGRIACEGPDGMLSAKQALMLALGLHELIANAVKYGALANEHGMVAVTWRLAGERQNQLVFDWEERGGPHVTAPLKTGFGTRILSEVLPAEFEGSARLAYAGTGFHFHMEGKLADLSG